MKQRTQTRALSGLAKWCAVLGASIIVVSYCVWCVNTYRASRWARSGDLDGFRNSTLLRPANSRYHADLGRALLTSGDFSSAHSELQQAVSLNSHDAASWLILAELAEVNGDAALRRTSIARALAANPSTPTVLWEAANFHLAAGEPGLALPIFRKLLSYDRQFDNSVSAVLAGSSTPSAVALQTVLPPRVEAYVSYLQRLLLRRRFADSKHVWQRIVELRQPIPPEGVAPYFSALIEAKQIQELQRAWTQTVASNPGMSTPAPGELMTNGGFEDRLSAAGLDWIFDDSGTESFAIDTSEFQSGLRSLRAQFSSDESGNIRVRQLVPVQPGEPYRLTLSVKSEDLLSASGPHVAVFDAFTGKELGSTEELLGSSSWRALEVNFTASADTTLIKISLVRTAPSVKIRGRVWLDDVSLRRASAD